MWSVKANVKAPHRFLRMGAKCWLANPNPGWAGEKIEVYGMSRGGRIVRTWVDSRDLCNFRAAFSMDDCDHTSFPSREDAQSFADSMNERFGNQPVRPYAAAFGVNHA